LGKEEPNTFLGVDGDVELAEEELAEHEQTDVAVPAEKETIDCQNTFMNIQDHSHSPLDDLVDQLFAERFLGLVVARHLGKDLRLPAPILQHLRRRFHKVARDAKIYT
jgi:hypothetical protein